MSVTEASSVDLGQMLEQAERLAGIAGRSDLVERLGVARRWLGGRPLHVAVAGAHHDGVEPLSRVLRTVSSGWLPGASFVDAPGWVGTERGQSSTAADVMLFVSDAGRLYGPADLDALTRMRARQVPVAGVRTSFDARSEWASIQQTDRQTLHAAGLDQPPIPLLPVSTSLCENGWRLHDDAAVVASGIPQLLEYLRDRIDTPVDRRLRDAILHEVSTAVEQLIAWWTDELTRARRDGSVQDRYDRAVAELDRRQQRSTAWQITLNDGVTEMSAQLDFDLRERLREVLEHADEQIGKADPLDAWSTFDASVRDEVDAATRANHQLLRERASGLAKHVAATMTATAPSAPPGVALPRITATESTDALQPMDAPESKGSLLARIVNSVRGSYGGILMVGVLTSLAGLQLISVYSVSAGVLLGLFTFFEDRKNNRDRSTGEARIKVAKLLDTANFRAGDHLRTQLRGVHRSLRDHFTVINDKRLREAADEVRLAADASSDHDRVAELDAGLAELWELQQHARTRARGPQKPSRSNGHH